jgi:nicotinate dehydrogenase subunit A
MTIALMVNGAAVSSDLPADTALVHALRDGLGLVGTRWGCGAEACGACTVLVDGVPAYACTLSLDAVTGRALTTVEGLGTREAPHPLQKAFLTEQAGQCGYCLSGILVRAAALLATNPAPDEAAVRAALDPCLCRCGAQNRMVRAVLRAAREGATA